MSENQRLHPAAIFVSFLQNLREMIIPIIIFVLFGRGGGDDQHWFFNFQTFLIIGFILLFLYGLFTWLTFTYQLKDQEIVIRQGIFIKKTRFIRQERIQSIDLSAGVIQRMFNLVQLRIETAGGGDEPEVRLIAITRSDAEQLRNSLLQRKNNSESNETLLEEHDEAQEEAVEWKLSRKDLILAALTSSGIGLTLSALLALFSQIEQFLPESFYENTFGIVVGTSIVAIMFFLIVVIFIAWVISITAAVLKYGRFTINKRGDELVISRGLLEQRHLTLALHRITSIRIVSSVLRQPFGFAAVYVESAGGGSKDEQLSTILFPLARKKEITALLREVVPEFGFEYQIKRVPKRALIRYLLRALIPTAIVLAAIIYIIPYGYYSLIVVPFACLLGYLQYKDAGFGVNDHHLWFRFRTLNQTIVLTPKKAIQSSEMRQALFQKRRKLATFSVAILSSIIGKSFQVKDLGESDAFELLEWAKRKKVNNVEYNVKQEEQQDI